MLTLTLFVFAAGGRIAEARQGEVDIPLFDFAPAPETQNITDETRAMRARAAREPGVCRIFVEEPTSLERARRGYTGKPLEPVYGAYLGAFIDREDGVRQYFRGVNGQIHKDVGEFNRTIGKEHASFFMYQRYGFPFPDAWFAHLKRNGAAGQWVIQPEHLDDVKDDAYLRGIAEAAARTGVPTFVRFAGEMNGNWVPYHGDPAKYKEKFRLIARTFHRYAPNVAVVWCPNEVPTSLIESYFPGDEYVDWVGVNFYSVYFANNDPNYPVAGRNPAEALEYVYKKYAARHPILVGEWAATHQAALDGVMRPNFAADKISELYGALPRQFPRVKAVHWFSMNALKWAPPARRINNYALLELPEVARRYREMVDVDYFLGRIPPDNPHPMAATETIPLPSGYPLRGTVTLSAYVKTKAARPLVICTVAGREIARFDTPGHYRTTFDVATLPSGATTVVYEARHPASGKVLARTVIPVRIGSASGSTSPAPPAPKPTPVGKTGIVAIPSPTPTVGTVALPELLRRAKANPKQFSISASPGTRVPLGGGFRFTVSSTAGGWLVLFVDDPDGSRTALYPGDRADTPLAPKAKRSVPEDAGQILRPNGAGRYVVRALLLPDKPTRDAILQAIAGQSVRFKPANYPIISLSVTISPK